MLHYVCRNCQMGFQARSHDEALEELKETTKTGSVDESTAPAASPFTSMVSSRLVLVYAKYCPYCGSEAIEQR